MVFEMLREMLAESLGCDDSEITLSSELRDDLGLSDGQLNEVMEAMASELGFRYDSGRIEDADTVRELVGYISQLL